ncbi:MAG: structural protein [Cellvibrionaceae bacterium]
MKTVNLVRGLRNNNPGNIRENQRVDYDWEGEAANDTDSEFEEFVSPEYGVRAMVRILRSYRNRGVTTLGEIISTWAPAIENDTGSYINSVSQKTGLSAVDEVTELNYLPLVKAIIRHENGLQPYSDELLKHGIEMGLA